MRPADDLHAAGSRPGPGDEPRVLFYTHSARAFTSTLIGHLREIAAEFPVVLAAEALPDDYVRLLQDRTLFPKLEKVIFVQGLGYTASELIGNNRRWLHLADSLIQESRPTVVVAENDMGSLFEMYLMRAAKKAGAATLAIQAMANFGEGYTISWIELIHLHAGAARFPGSGLLRRLRRRLRKEMGHFFVHFVLPWSAGQRALRGRSSYVKYLGASGMRDADLYLALTPEVHAEFLQRGVRPERLAVLRHPLARNAPRNLYCPPSPDSPRPSPARQLLVLLGFVRIGFDKQSLRPFPPERRQRAFQEILRLASELLPDWRIILKGHPNWQTPGAIRSFLGEIPASIEVVDPRAPVEPMLARSDGILDMPPAVSTVLFTASLAWPEKPIIAADVLAEFYGDNFKGFPGIDYVDSPAALEQLLRGIAASAYAKPPPSRAIPPGAAELANTAEAIRAVLHASRYAAVNP